MDQQVITQKLESLRRYIARIETKKPPSASDLDNDLDLQDILSVNLERAIQLCVDIGTHIIASSEKEAPETMGETFRSLYELKILTSDTAEVMNKAVGFRKIAVHNYEKINWSIVLSICTKQLDDLKKFVAEMNAYISGS